MKKEIIDKEPICPLCKSDMKEWVGGYWCRNGECGAYIESHFRDAPATNDRTAIIKVLEFYAKWVSKGEYKDIDNDVTVYIAPAPLTIDGGEKAKKLLKILSRADA